MGHSTGCRQVHPATTFKFVETFRVCREFFADHFCKKLFQNKHCFRKDTAKIQKMHFCFFSKSFLNFFRNFNESSTFFTQILKLTTYSDSP